MISRPHRCRLWAVFLVLSGCTDPYEPSVPASPERYAIELAAAYCDYGVRCESPADAERFSAFCHPAAVAQQLADLLERQPHMTYDAEAAGRCLRTIELASASCSVPLCEPVLVGTLLAGQACDEADQCAPGLTCSGVDDGLRCSGVCEPTASEGDRCRDDVECGEGLHCEDRRCAPDRAAGERCRHSSDCEAGLLCDQEREECYPPSEAEGRSCEDEGPDRCPVPTDCVDDVCQRYEPGRVAGPGEPCEVGECAASHFCDGGFCAPRPVLTEPCDERARCVEGRCVAGSCQLLPPRSTCRVDRECSTDRCTMGRCEVPSAVGAPCEGDRDCANGLECSERRCVVGAPCS